MGDPSDIVGHLLAELAILCAERTSRQRMARLRGDGDEAARFGNDVQDIDEAISVISEMNAQRPDLLRQWVIDDLDYAKSHHFAKSLREAAWGISLTIRSRWDCVKILVRHGPTLRGGTPGNHKAPSGGEGTVPSAEANDGSIEMLQQELLERLDRLESQLEQVDATTMEPARSRLLTVSRR